MKTVCIFCLLAITLHLTACAEVGVSNFAPESSPQPSSHVFIQNSPSSSENDGWQLQYLDFQEQEGLQYDGLAFWSVSVLDNKVYLGNTDAFVQYADLLNGGEIITKALPERKKSRFRNATKDGYVFAATNDILDGGERVGCFVSL